MIEVAKLFRGSRCKHTSDFDAVYGPETASLGFVNRVTRAYLSGKYRTGELMSVALGKLLLFAILCRCLLAYTKSV